MAKEIAVSLGNVFVALETWLYGFRKGCIFFAVRKRRLAVTEQLRGPILCGIRLRKGVAKEIAARSGTGSLALEARYKHGCMVLEKDLEKVSYCRQKGTFWQRRSSFEDNFIPRCKMTQPLGGRHSLYALRSYRIL